MKKHYSSAPSNFDAVSVRCELNFRPSEPVEIRLHDATAGFEASGRASI